MEYQELTGVIDVEDIFKQDDVYIDDITQYDHDNTIVIQLSNGYQLTLKAN